MGRFGPRKTPTATLRLRGNHNIAERKGEVAAITGDPIRHPLVEADPEACAMWDRMLVRMRSQQILSEAWGETLASLCLAWSRMIRAESEIRDMPLVLTNDAGRVFRNPVHSAARELRDEFSRLSREFGLTPASKADVKVTGSPQNTGKKRYFKGGA